MTWDANLLTFWLANKPIPKKSTSDQTKTVTEGVGKLDLVDTPTPKAKLKTIDVATEFEKTESKPAANFVVIGKPERTLILAYEYRLTSKRSCRSR